MFDDAGVSDKEDEESSELECETAESEANEDTNDQTIINVSTHRHPILKMTPNSQFIAAVLLGIPNEDDPTFKMALSSSGSSL